MIRNYLAISRPQKKLDPCQNIFNQFKRTKVAGFDSTPDS
jgi:hypothetical protein